MKFNVSILAIILLLTLLSCTFNSPQQSKNPYYRRPRFKSQEQSNASSAKVNSFNSRHIGLS